jgi:dynein heavy chain
MVSEVQYGGKITDDLDRRMFSAYTERWMSPNCLNPDFTYNPESPIQPIHGDFEYRIPNNPEHADYVKFMNSMPEQDSPEIFGLHPNADLTFRIKSTNSLLNTLSETQPKDSGGDDTGPSLDEVVKAKAGELVAAMPPDFNIAEAKASIAKQGGMGLPLNIFLFQEVQVIQQVIAKVRFDLIQLQLAIDGDVVMTNELQKAMMDIFEARVPNHWVWTIAGDEFSWIATSIGKWFESLQSRCAQFAPWLASGQPNSFWLTGFKNPNGFLTSMKQVVTRKHKAEGWALDDVFYMSNVQSEIEPAQVKSKPEEGVYIHGLFLDGASWHQEKSGSGSLVESAPKVLFCPLPVLHITGATKSMIKEAKSSYGPHGPYEAPLYKYKSRTDRWIICMVSLSTMEAKPSHWVLRGVALTCNTDS